jgi:hypothetical protein
MLPDTFQKRCPTIRLIYFVGRNPDIEQRLSIKLQAIVGWDDRREVAKVPSIQAVRFWDRRWILKNFRS